MARDYAVVAKYDCHLNYEPGDTHYYDGHLHRLPNGCSSHGLDLCICDTHVVSANGHAEFIGVDAIYEQQRSQVVQFCEWAAAHDWQAFHNHHYDWWAFPIDRPSQHGFAYSVFEAERAALLERSKFRDNLAEAAHLLLLSWGWDMSSQQFVPNPEPGQAWANWPIRWSKCTTSLQLFGLAAEHASAQQFGRQLLDRGVSFSYRGRDLAAEHGLSELPEN